MKFTARNQSGICQRTFYFCEQSIQFSTQVQQKNTTGGNGKINTGQKLCEISKYSKIKNVKETGLIAACILPRAETRQTSPRLT